MRKWQHLELDEICSIWKAFQITEFALAENKNPENYGKTMRLTPLEIMKLVDDLLIRLNNKQAREEAKNAL